MESVKRKMKTNKLITACTFILIKKSQSSVFQMERESIDTVMDPFFNVSLILFPNLGQMGPKSYSIVSELD